ncbi:DUF2442 domain-containing protein [Methylobacterium pseudosasicola]|uniref:DUF2442 domain-containing protein n=1 Tax=Methylobacterium pseudosasicola TaxID=582667 RepID=UPI001113D450|nr:DUF2442 domain-containing protein [Methylobacterium pseudosasicola]
MRNDGHVVSEAEFARAVQQGRQNAKRGFRVRFVRYWPDYDAVAIMTEHQGGFLVPRASIEPLRDLDVNALSRLELCPGGAAFEIADLDIHVSIHGLLTDALPAVSPTKILSR